MTPPWATRRWGLVRVLVLVFSAAALAGVPLLTTVDPETDGAIWVIVVGVALAGAASATRAGAVPLPHDGTDWRIPPPVARALWADAGWSLLLLVAALAVRAVVGLAGGATASELLMPLVLVLGWGMSWLLGALPGFIIGFVVALAVRGLPAHAGGAGTAWPLAVLLVAVLGVLVFATLSLTVLDVPNGRFAEFLVHDLDAYSTGEAAIAWATRVSVLLLLAAAVVLIVRRFRPARGR